jgi:hypothetical protein
MGGRVGLGLVNFKEDDRLCPAAPGALALSEDQDHGGRVHGHHVGLALAREDMVPPVVGDGFPLPLHPCPRQGRVAREELGAVLMSFSLEAAAKLSQLLHSSMPLFEVSSPAQVPDELAQWQRGPA